MNDPGDWLAGDYIIALSVIEALGGHVAHERARRGITLRQLAKESGVSLGTTWKVIDGRPTTPGVVVKLLNWLIVSRKKEVPDGKPRRQ